MFVIFGGLLVLALFAALIGPYFIDWSSYRQDFEREAGRILGQKVQVRGSAEARLIPFPSVTFGDVVVGEAGAGEPMMTIDRFAMDVELAPFLSGEIRIFDMRIEGPKAFVRLSEDGELDWALRSERSFSGQPVILENITVTGGDVTIIDDQNGRRHTAEDLDLRMSAKSIEGPWQIDGAGRFDGYASAFSLSTGAPLETGGVRLRAGIYPDALPVAIQLEGDARIEDLKPRYSGNFTADITAPSADETAEDNSRRNDRPAQTRVSGKFELDNERLRLPEYRLQTGPKDNPYIVTGEATFDTGSDPEFLLIADGQQFNLDRIDSEDANPADFAGSRPFRERLADFHEFVSLAPVPKMPGKVSVALPAIVAGDTTFRDISLEAIPENGAWKLEKLEAKLPGRTTFLANGRLGVDADYGFSGEIVVASLQPSGFASWLSDSVDPSIRRLDRAGLSASVELSPQLQRMENLEIAVGSATLNGRLERIVPRQGRPSLSLVLEGETVDADALRAFSALVAGDQEANRLSGHDIGVRMSADSLQFAGLDANDFDIAVRLKSGTLDIDRLTVNDLAGVSVTMVGRLDNAFTAPAGDLDITLTAEQLGDVAKALGDLGFIHPATDHLRRNANLFDNTTVNARARFLTPKGGATQLIARASGNSGGSQFSAVFEKKNIHAPMSQNDMSAKIDVNNYSSHTMLRQFGIDLLDAGADSAASASLQMSDNADAHADFSLGYLSGDLQFNARGEAWGDEEDRLLGDFTFDMTSSDLSPYLLAAGFSFGGPQAILPTKVNARVKADAETLSLQSMEGAVEDIRFTGNLTTPRDRTEIALSGDLALSELDLGWLAETVLGEGAVSFYDGTWSNAGFAPSSFGETRFDIDVTAQSARLPASEAIRDFKGKLVLEDGELQLRDLAARWLDGDLGGSISLSNRGGTGIVSGRFELGDAQLAPLLWDYRGQPVASGDLDLSLTLEGSGKSMQGLVTSLTGTGIAAVRDLEIRGIGSGALGRLLDAADREGFETEADNVADVAGRIIRNGGLYSARVSAPFTMAAGVIRVSNMRFEDTGVTVTGDARIDLPQDDMESEFRVEYDPGLEALTGAVPAVTLEFSGPIGAPSVRVNAAELTNYLSLRAFERERRRVELLQAVVLEKQRMRREVMLSRDYPEQRIRIRRLELQQQEEQRKVEEERQRQEEERLKREEEQLRETRAQERAAVRVEEDAQPVRDAAPANVPTPRPAPDTAPANGGDGVPLVFDDLYKKLEEAVFPNN
nr:AsmA family protein [Flavimaribacter sediminis]